VDTETEVLIQQALDQLSTVQNADRIIVLQDGRIVEMGRHAELVDGEGLYARLCRAQSTTDLGPADASALR
jgi:ABC-type multidrug transport system fused ATPase/permease subunit